MFSPLYDIGQRVCTSVCWGIILDRVWGEDRRWSPTWYYLIQPIGIHELKPHWFKTCEINQSISTGKV